jgi:UDP-N-acetylglucosamine:LPS N-acetylglucosamine transferase
MMIVQKVHPCAFMVSMRSTSQEEAETRGKLLERAGLTDVIVVRADEYGLQDLIPCADVVVSPKGSAAAEAVIAGRPAIVNDLRPQLDEWAWREKGIIASRSDDPQKLAEAIVKCMHDEETILRLEAERRDGRLWFNGPGGASEKIGRKIVEVCDGS